MDNRWTTSDAYSEMHDARAIPNNVIQIMSPDSSIPQQPQQHRLRTSNIVNVGSDISDDEGSTSPIAPGQIGADRLPSTESAELTREIRTVPGPDVEFTFPADSIASDKVTLCGSWSNWKEHWNLTRDGVGSDLRVMVRGIPPGLHHFKVREHGGDGIRGHSSS